jgi:hypothetical protein
MEMEMNPGWEEEIGRQARSHMQSFFDTIYDRHAGQPVEEVKDALRQKGIDEPQLTAIATAISEGTRVRVSAA